MGQNPPDPSALLAGVGDIEAVRIALRWALERIRSLEAADKDVLVLREQARAAKEQAERELVEARRSFEKRLRAVDFRELYVADMRRFLDERPQADAATRLLLEQRQKLEEEYAALREWAQRRVDEAQAEARRAFEGSDARFAELEAALRAALEEEKDRLREELREGHALALRQAEEGWRSDKKALLEQNALKDAQISAQRDALDSLGRSVRELEATRFAQAADHLKAVEEQFEARLRGLEEARMRLEEDHAGRERQQAEAFSARLREAEGLHDRAVAELQRELGAARASFEASHLGALAAHRDELEKAEARHQAELRALREAQAEHGRREAEAADARLAELEGLHAQALAKLHAELDHARAAHQEELQKAELRNQAEARALREAQAEHGRREAEAADARLAELEGLHAQALAKLHTELDHARAAHQEELQKAELRHQAEARALREAQAEHGRREAEAADARLAELEGLHAQALAKLHAELDHAHAALEAQALAKDAEAAARSKRLEEAHAARVREAEERHALSVAALTKELDAARAALEAQGLAKDAEAAERYRHLEELLHRESAALQDDARKSEERHQVELRALHDGQTRLEEAHAARVREAEERHALSVAALTKELDAARAALEAQALAKDAEAAEHARRLGELHQRELAARGQEADALREAQARLEEDNAARAREAEERHARALSALAAELDGARAENMRLVEAHSEALYHWQKEAGARENRREEELVASHLEQLALERERSEQRRMETERALCAPREEAPAARRPWRLAAALAAACSLAAWAVYDSGREYVIPTRHPSAMVWKGDVLWVSDWFERALYSMKLGPSGLEVLKRYDMADTHAVGIALAGDTLFVADSWAGRIRRFRLGDTLTPEADAASPGPKPSALYFDGTYLWSADLELRRVYQHATDPALTVLKEYAVPEAPVGLYADGREFWAADAQSQSFMRHRLPPDLGVEGAYRLRELSEDGWPLSAFTWRGRRLWVAKDGSDRLLVRPRWRLAAAALPGAAPAP